MKTLKKGILVAIEGIDGSGKSTLAHTLHQELLQHGYPALLTKEPGATPLGKELRSLVQEKKVSICAKAEFLLFATDRAQHFDEYIIPQLHAGKLIISDRMADSSIVYQGYGRGLDKSMIETINAWAMNGIKPDVTIFVQTTLVTAQNRIAKRNAALTSFEQEKEDFIKKLIDGFTTLYHTRNDVITIDGNQTQETVTKQAITKLISWIMNNQLIQK